MERIVPFLKNEFFHVYNRGVDKRKIFFTKHDYAQFVARVYVCNTTHSVRLNDALKYKKSQGLPLRYVLEKGIVHEREPLVDIIAWCLMPNHFHFVLRGREDGSVSKFMAKLGTSYAMYMNVKYDRTGPLMCRPFRAKHVSSDEYFRWLLSYIHLNPVDLIEPEWKKKGIKNVKKAEQFLQGYFWSSYQDYYQADRPEAAILSKEALPINISGLDNLNRMLKELKAGNIARGVLAM